MKRTLLGVGLCMFLIAMQNTLQGQTIQYDINYVPAGLSTTICNIFNINPQKVIGGVTHYPVSGGAMYSAHAINLFTTGGNTSATTFGTAYALRLNIRKNHQYTIKISVYRASASSNSSPNLEVGMLKVLPGNTQPYGCGAVDKNTFSPLLASRIGFVNVNNGSPANEYTLTQDFVPNDNFSYFTILGWGGDYNVNSTLYISSITIIDKPPYASFSLSPNAIPFTCGSTTPITFTANNDSNAPDVTNYSWNLGATPNGWLLPNGSPAPATYSTGLSNTLTLTPVCGAALGNVTTTVTAWVDNNYNTNTSVVSVATPALSIVGSNLLCSGVGQYSISGLPCNSLVAWTKPPTGVASLNDTGASPVNLSYDGTSGAFDLTANVKTCGVQQTLILPMHAGPYISTDYTLNGNSGSNTWCPNQNLTFSVSGAQSNNFNWSVPAGWTTVYNPNSNYIMLKSPSSSNPPTGTLSASFTEPCATSITLNRFLYYNGSMCTPTSPYTVSPNPASSTITIACASLQTYCNIAAVQITDSYGAVKSSQSWPYTNQQVQMSVGFLPNGTYIARVYDGSQWYSTQFMVSH